MSVQATPTLPARIQWRRHWIVLLRATGLAVMGLLTLAIVPMASGGTTSIWARGLLVFGSLVLIWRAATLPRRSSPNAQAPAAQRQSALHRVTAPIRWLMSIIAITLVLLAFGSVAASFAFPTLLLPLKITYWTWAVFVLLWFLLNAIDWQNDLYILTHDRIIDQVRFPLLYDQRTEARLDQVQNVRYQQGFWGGILGFGDVTVETAGHTQAVLFLDVPNPRYIQGQIFERIDQLNERRSGEDAKRQRDQLSGWFRAYHTLTGRIEIISLPESTQFPRPIHVEWWINTQPTQSYKTWIAYDSVSLAEGQSHPETDPFESTGRRRVHQIIPVTSRGDVHLKIWLRLLAPADSGQADEDLATRELTVRVE